MSTATASRLPRPCWFRTTPRSMSLRKCLVSTVCLPSAVCLAPLKAARRGNTDGKPVARKPTGRMFKIQKNLCAFFCQTTSGKACAHDKRTKRERERPERAAIPQPRATPWVPAYKRQRPVRAKVWANGWLLLLPLQGVGNGDMVPRALPWARDLLGFQPAQRRRQGFFRTISIYLVFLDFEHPSRRGHSIIRCQ